MADGVDQDGGWSGFTRDLGASLRAWKQAPALPLLTTVLAAGVSIPTARPEFQSLFFFTLPVLVFSVGWPGTERLWYLRVWRGGTLSGAQVWRATWRYFGRFLWLGLTCGLISLPLVVPALALVEGGHRSSAYAIVIAITTALFDVGLTFVTPALAYSTPEVGTAIRSGLRFLRETWPRCAWYALVPPLAFTALGRALPESAISGALRFGLLVLTAPIALLFKGASAAFYIRHHDVGDDGSVNMTFGTASHTAPAQPERPG